MKTLSKVTDIHEVIMDAPRFDESTLGIGDESGHVRGKPDGEHFCNYLGKSVDEANGSIVDDPLQPFLLR